MSSTRNAGGVLLSSPGHYKTTDTFTATGTGAIRPLPFPLKNFALQIVSTGGTPTVWTVTLEGSLDGVNFSTILAHTNVTGLGAVLWTGTNDYPALYARTNCTALTLSGATNIVAHWLGM